MKVLVVTNLYPDADSPRRGRFVADQVEALRDLGVEVKLFRFGLGARSYLRAVRPLRRLLRDESFDVVHAHYGLCGWTAARAGASPLIVTFHGTDVRHPAAGAVSRRVARRVDLAAGASSSIFAPEGGRPGLDAGAGRAVALPCGVDLERFRPIPRPEARDRAGLDPDGAYLLFPADPQRAVKRFDRAAELAERTGATLLSAGEIDPERMPDFVNGSNAVLITSDSEGFGLAALEALACRVPVLSTPVGIVPLALLGIEGCLVAPFDPERWAGVARLHLDSADPRTPEAWAARAFSARRTAERVLAAYEGVAGESRKVRSR